MLTPSLVDMLASCFGELALLELSERAFLFALDLRGGLALLRALPRLTCTHRLLLLSMCARTTCMCVLNSVLTHPQTTAADYRAVLAKMRPNVSPCAIVHPLKTWR